MKNEKKVETKSKADIVSEKIRRILKKEKMDFRIVQGINPNGTIGATLQLVDVQEEVKK